MCVCVCVHKLVCEKAWMHIHTQRLTTPPLGLQLWRLAHLIIEMSFKKKCFYTYHLFFLTFNSLTLKCYKDIILCAVTWIEDVVEAAAPFLYHEEAAHVQGCCREGGELGCLVTSWSAPYTPTLPPSGLPLNETNLLIYSLKRLQSWYKISS